MHVFAMAWYELGPSKKIQYHHRLLTSNITVPQTAPTSISPQLMAPCLPLRYRCHNFVKHLVDDVAFTAIGPCS